MFWFLCSSAHFSNSQLRLQNFLTSLTTAFVFSFSLSFVFASTKPKVNYASCVGDGLTCFQVFRQLTFSEQVEHFA